KILLLYIRYALVQQSKDFSVISIPRFGDKIGWQPNLDIFRYGFSDHITTFVMKAFVCDFLFKTKHGVEPVEQLLRFAIARMDQIRFHLVCRWMDEDDKERLENIRLDPLKFDDVKAGEMVHGAEAYNFVYSAATPGGDNAEETANNNGDIKSKAQTGTSATTAAQLTDTNAPVDLGTESNYSYKSNSGNYLHHWSYKNAKLHKIRFFHIAPFCHY
ncbi:hypothetical protein ACJX0J_016762, partial [Zea mays]